MSENKAINHEIIEDIGIIKGTNPPVNALSHAVRTGLISSLQELTNNENVKGYCFNWGW